MSKFELISFELCPFVQRSVITLKKKNVEFDIKYIDLKDKPGWFLKISPLGKVPVLNVNGTILFESAVINEFLDDVTDGSSLPNDPLEKAQYRAWIEFSSQLIMDLFRMIMQKEEDGFNKLKSNFLEKLSRLEAEIPGGEFFNGESFSLVDASIAPAFTRTLLCEQIFDVDLLSPTPKVKLWASKLCEKEYVKKSVKSDFEDKFIQYLIDADSYLARHCSR